MNLIITFAVAGLLCAGCDRATPALSSNADARPSSGQPEAEHLVATAGARTTTSTARATEEVRLAAGTRLPVVLETTIGSDISRVEEPVRARVTRDVIVHGTTVVPAGSVVKGVVTDAARSGKVKGRARIGVRFDTLARGAEEYRIHTAAVGRVAPGTKKKDALEIGIPAAGGALIGGLIGGGKGAAIGTAAGGGAGTAVVLSTRGKEIHLAKGAPLTLRLTEPVAIRVPR